jgi:hypothetical protein
VGTRVDERNSKSGDSLNLGTGMAGNTGDGGHGGSGDCWEIIAHAHIDADHRVMSHDRLFEKLVSVDTNTG